MEQLNGIDVIDLSKKDKIKPPENELIFNGRTLHFRKWKVKDKFELDKAKTLPEIRKALVYFFEIKGNSIEKANGGIGIVPYVYQQAYNYYLALWQAQQKNQDKIIVDYIPKVKEVTIPKPQRKIKKQNLFTFLDEEKESE